ncbi:hypothetical protein SUGI_1455450 [Cryptomeria japonica]|uniref:Uncharacterized protein n=1 Tax=Cryptomeria japonica TaxID=3369 RepID=A0AAD3NT01_CRYJA|nr:hypothetical protein SUGI_1424800 [Cryptomeria japonica]GLJ58519.1 hypothetical protein SUGI_1455450 [Cryptomeria japonica]
MERVGPYYSKGGYPTSMRGTDRVVVAASFPSIPARAAVLKGRVGPVGGYSLQSVGEEITDSYQMLRRGHPFTAWDRAW